MPNQPGQLPDESEQEPSNDRKIRPGISTKNTIGIHLSIELALKDVQSGVKSHQVQWQEQDVGDKKL